MLASSHSSVLLKPVWPVSPDAHGSDHLSGTSAVSGEGAEPGDRRPVGLVQMT